MKTRFPMLAAFLKRYKEKLLIAFVILLYVIAASYAGVTCIIRELTGYPCPGCGMTRALLAAVQLRISEAFRYHWMFWSVPILFFAFLKDGKLLHKKRDNIILYVCLLAGFIMNWLRNLMIGL